RLGGVHRRGPVGHRRGGAVRRGPQPGPHRFAGAPPDHRDAEGGREVVEEPDRIRDDIELTRAQLAHNVDRLADKTSPTRVAQRGWRNTKEKVLDVKDRVTERVMGAAYDGGSTVQDKTSSAVDTVKDKTSDAAAAVKDKAGDVATHIQQAPAAARRQTQ